MDLNSGDKKASDYGIVKFSQCDWIYSWPALIMSEQGRRRPLFEEWSSQAREYAVNVLCDDVRTKSWCHRNIKWSCDMCDVI